MKITKYILSFAAAAGLLAACQTPEIVQIASPENVVPASLHELEVDEIAISATNQQETVSFSWEAADYGAPTQVTYSLEAALDQTSDKVAILSGLAKTEAVVTYEDLNRVLFNDLQVPEGQPTELKFYVGSVLSAGSSISSYPKVYSEPITITITVTAAEKVYPKVWVIGDYCGWGHDKSQFLFDFVGDDKVYQGVVDFGEKAANGWKITGVGKWDDNCNWGGDEAVTYDPEAAKTQLINGGGSKDLKHYSKRFYHFSLEKETLLLTNTIGFDNIGVVGSFNGWSEVNNVEMNFNASKQRFYADVEFAEDAEFKFNIDKAWTVSFGVGANGFLTSQDGANITAKAGNYRVYLNMNNYGEITYELSKGMYGQDEPTAGTTTPDTPDTPDTPEEPTPVTGWSLIGAFNDWNADLMLTYDGKYHVVKGAELQGELKFRKDGQWNYKDESGNEIQTNLGAAEGVTFAANTELALVGAGANIVVTAGTYDVYLDAENSKAWFITDGSYPGGSVAPTASPWALIGEFNSWNGDYPMYVEGEYHVAKGFVVATDGKMKFRKDGMWNYKDADGNDVQTNLGGTFAANAAIALTGGGSDLAVTAGTYDVYLKVAEDGQSGTAYFMTDGKKPSDAGDAPEPEVPTELTWYLVGQFNNWTVADAAYTMTKGAEWYVFKGFVSDGLGFKFNAGSWDINRGATGEVEPFELTANAEYEIVNNGKNFSIAAGTYDVYMNLETTKVYIMEQGLTPGQTPSTPEPEEPEFEAKASEWGVVGDVNGWNAPDVVMYTTPTEGLFVARNVQMPAGSFKIRANGAWVDTANYGVETAGNVEVDHVYKVITGGGSGNMTLAAGTYDIWFDLTNTKVYIMTPGKDIAEAKTGTPVAPLTDTWYLVGDFNGWKAADANYEMTSEGTWYVFKNFKADGKGMKFVGDANWQNERVGTFKSANTAISVAKGSGNMFPTAGTYDVYLSADTKTAYFMTPGTKPAN